MPNIYGVLPVLEALRAGARRIDRIVIAEGVRDARLREVLEAARSARVPVRREPRGIAGRGPEQTAQVEDRTRTG